MAHIALLVFWLNLNPSQFNYILWGLLIWTILFSILKIVRFICIQQEGDKLKIHFNFSPQYIKIEDIERVEIKYGPFTQCKILVKNDKRDLKLSFQEINEKDLKRLLKELNIPLETN